VNSLEEFIVNLRAGLIVPRVCHVAEFSSPYVWLTLGLISIVEQQTHHRLFERAAIRSFDKIQLRYSYFFRPLIRPPGKPIVPFGGIQYTPLSRQKAQTLSLFELTGQ